MLGVSFSLGAVLPSASDTGDRQGCLPYQRILPATGKEACPTGLGQARLGTKSGLRPPEVIVTGGQSV